jgi:hypothetical protein
MYGNYWQFQTVAGTVVDTTSHSLLGAAEHGVRVCAVAAPCPCSDVLFPRCSSTQPYSARAKSPRNRTRLASYIRRLLRNLRFITVLTRARHWSQSCSRWSQSTPCFPNSILFRVTYFFMIFNQTFLRISYLPSACYMPCLCFSY